MQKQIDYKVGECLVPLTIELLRSRYKISSKKYHKIEHFSPQSSADRLRILEIKSKDNEILVTLKEEYDEVQIYDGEIMKDEVFENVDAQYFTPNGNLTEGFPWENNPKIHKNWLSSDKPGPYNGTNNRTFFYLQGEIDGYQKEKDGLIQVSAGPINTLSYDALDSITLWVHE